MSKITFMGEQVDVTTDKKDQILYAEYTDSSKNATFHCGRVLINYDEEDGRSHSMNPVAKELCEDCGIDLSVGNKFIVRRIASDEQGNLRVVAIVFEDVTTFEAAIKQMMKKNAYGEDFHPSDTYAFGNPNVDVTNWRLEPVALISYSKKRMGYNHFQVDDSSIQILSGEQVDWNAIDIGCKNFLFELMNLSIAGAEELNKIITTDYRPSSFKTVDETDIQEWKKELKEKNEKLFNPNSMRSPETDIAYRILSQHMEQMQSKINTKR